MIRWTIICASLCVLTVGIVFAASHPRAVGDLFTGKGLAAIQGQEPVIPPAAKGDKNNGNDRKPGDGGQVQGAPRIGEDGQFAVVVREQVPTAVGQTYSIHNGRVQPIYKLDVPAERDGKLVFLATEPKPGEIIPVSKKIIRPSWAVAYQPDDPEKDNILPEELLTVKDKPGVWRRVRENDTYKPGKVALGFVMREYRKLTEGDVVERGQLLALVDPVVAHDEAQIKIAGLDVAEAEIQTAVKTKEEAHTRWRRIVDARIRNPGAFSAEEESGAKLTYERYVHEEVAKRAAMIRAQRELSASISILKKHEIRADINGVIKVIYKRQDEAVKILDPIMQIQNPEFLRVEALMDVQDLSKVSKGGTMTVEPTVAEPPMRILRGHLLEVHSVAVSKVNKTDPAKPYYTIVSGSEDRTARGWDSRNGQELWMLRHRSAVSAVACTGEKAEANLALLGSTDGSARIVDLNDLKKDPIVLEKRHQGAVLCVAFSPDGKICATGGDDRTIHLWDTDTGKLLKSGTIPAAHKAAVTSVQFASDEQLVSAGRDNILRVWTIKPNQPASPATEFDRRSGTVEQLGVSPDGKSVLFDQGKELRVLSMADRQIEGILQNYGASANFSTMALFAPNGQTILTNSAAEGRLQLWRTPRKGRAGELRQFIWGTGNITCGAFAPDSAFAVTGTQDHSVLMWQMPSKDEIDEEVKGRVSLIEQSLDAGSSRQVRIWVDVINTNKKTRLIPGSIATLVPDNP